MLIVFIFILVSLIGGSNAALVKFSLKEFPPILLVFLRFFLACLIMLPIILQRRVSIKQSSVKDIILAGLFVSGNVLFFAIGIGHTSIIMSQIIYLPSALLVGVIGYVFLQEKLSKIQLIGLVITMIGMGILIKGSIQTEDILSFGKPIGNALIGLALISWSLFLIFSRKLSKIYPPFTITFFNFVTISFISLIFSLLELHSNQVALSNATMTGVISVFALAIFSSVLFYFLMQWLVKYASAFIASLTIYVNLLFAAIFGIVFFSERLTPDFIVGGLLILFGVFLATSYQQIKNNIHSVLQ